MSSFVITKRFNGLYKFEFTSKRGKTIFTSLGYELKFECEAAIINFRSIADVCVFEKQKASGGKYMFVLLLNNEIFATSRKYSTELRLEKGIEEIKKYVVGAEILDFSNQEFVFDDNTVFD